MPPGTVLSLPEQFSLVGQRIVVTGAASGIGRATASALARLGAELVLADVNSLKATCADLAPLGVVPEAIEGDLLAPGAIDRLFASGPVWAVVHSAAIVPSQIP